MAKSANKATKSRKAEKKVEKKTEHKLPTASPLTKAQLEKLFSDKNVQTALNAVQDEYKPAEQALDIRTKGNQVPDVGSVVVSMALLFERAYNAPVNLAILPLTREQIAKLPLDIGEIRLHFVGGERKIGEGESAKVVKYDGMPDGVRLFKDWKEASDPITKRMLATRIDRCVNNLHLARNIIAKEEEARENGFIVQLKANSPEIRVSHAKDIGKQTPYVVEKFIKLRFLGARSMDAILAQKQQRAARTPKNGQKAPAATDKTDFVAGEEETKLSKTVEALRTAVAPMSRVNDATLREQLGPVQRVNIAKCIQSMLRAFNADDMKDARINAEIRTAAMMFGKFGILPDITKVWQEEQAKATAASKSSENKQAAA